MMYRQPVGIIIIINEERLIKRDYGTCEKVGQQEVTQVVGSKLKLVTVFCGCLGARHDTRVVEQQVQHGTVAYVVSRVVEYRALASDFEPLQLKSRLRTVIRIRSGDGELFEVVCKGTNGVEGG